MALLLNDVAITIRNLLSDRRKLEKKIDGTNKMIREWQGMCPHNFVDSKCTACGTKEKS